MWDLFSIFESVFAAFKRFFMELLFCFETGLNGGIETSESARRSREDVERCLQQCISILCKTIEQKSSDELWNPLRLVPSFSMNFQFRHFFCWFLYFFNPTTNLFLNQPRSFCKIAQRIRRWQITLWLNFFVITDGIHAIIYFICWETAHWK
jgi:hypothetical protein